jgi:hypothetical protein
MDSESRKPAPPLAVTGEIYKATKGGFLDMLAASNARAAEGYTLVSLCALGTSSFGVVYVHNGQRAKREANLI